MLFGLVVKHYARLRFSFRVENRNCGDLFLIVDAFYLQQHETNFPKLIVEQDLGREHAPPHVTNPPLLSPKVCVSFPCVWCLYIFLL